MDTTAGIHRRLDSDGLCTLTLDQPGRSNNLIDEAFVNELGAHIDWLASADAAGVRGVLLCSGKPSFIVGADLFALRGFCDAAPSMPAGEVVSILSVLTRQLRRLETLGKPVACALEGPALGGGYELALACHWRVMSDDPRAQVGLPEVQVGLLPGGGGTQRLPRLIGIAAALPLLLEGRSLKADEALRRGLVDEVAPAAEVQARARAWLLSDRASAVARWDAKGYKFPGGGGAMDPRSVQTFVGAGAMTFARTLGNYPAAQAILCAVFEGSVVGFDRALEIETGYFAHLFREGTARRMIRTLFINKGQADKLVRRPPGVPATRFTRIGVLGAGMMGAGIACVAAQAGVEVVLIDRTAEDAARGKAFTAQQLAKAQARGRITAPEADAVLARITATTEYAGLAGAQLVIEAVFEDREVKAEVTRRAEAVMAADAVFASNTSTLPITGLAGASNRPGRFVGIHFFSPVEKMPLVEVIRGERTADPALAVALDLVKLLGKTPIVVNDGRGFYTTRFVSAYILEGQAMLLEGVPPALIEHAGRQAGMPVGPLALADEVALDLSYRIRQQWRKDLGAQYVQHPGEPVNDVMVVDQQRFGRKNGKGFYDYPADGGRKRLWPGLAQLFPPAPAGHVPEIETLKQRLLAVQALEAVRCLESGVLTHADDGDVGAIFGLGFAPFTGGPFSLIETVGVGTFVEHCRAFARAHGARYAPPALLVHMAERGETAFARG
jgi:3-hydroxyacyl-CoA dehydrogenase/enoyl-CoA hydratase/3-hydroxybutyryl-CoA epimerase